MKKILVKTVTVFTNIPLIIVQQAKAEESIVNSYIHAITDKVGICGAIEVEVGFEKGALPVC